MGFSTSCKDISLRKITRTGQSNITNLCAYCRGNDGQYYYSEITLDWHLGVDNNGGDTPRILMDGRNLTSYMLSDIRLDAGGSVLICTTLPARYFGYSSADEFSLCLDICFHNNNGKLVFEVPPKNVVSRVSRLKVNSWGQLSGYALNIYGKIRYTTINLGDHLANNQGSIERKRDGHFERSAHNIRLDWRWALCADLDRYPGDTNPGSIYCYQLLDNWMSIDDEGNLIMEDPAGTWDLRGPFFRLLEDIPVLGYVVAGIDEIEGDHDEAMRAVAECTYATIILAASMVGGVLLGPVGAAVASAVAGYAGMYAKAAIGRCISNPDMRNEVTAITVYRVLMAELFLIAGSGIGEFSGAFSDLLVEELMAEGFDDLVATMAGMMGKKGLKTMTKADMKMYDSSTALFDISTDVRLICRIIENLMDAIRNGKSEDEVKHMFNDFDNDGVDLLNA
ncbi:hypothetical protein N7495_000496 [Penicillium taxi]|uniref:uncharacterized protein n=1 Tax=Penicillium taxi TaxID=168475 RepID=UPI0025455B86|nr:uncharacterized protein N7495_000496 [Penicillium taxi]KAJ5907814.1 hypothetical protein N7495_000496 [Penicillium taxi]